MPSSFCWLEANLFCASSQILGVAETVNSISGFQTKSCSDHRLTSPTYTMHCTVFCTVACICLRFAVFSTAVRSALWGKVNCTALYMWWQGLHALHISTLWISASLEIERDFLVGLENKPNNLTFFLQHRTEKSIISSWKASLLAFPLLHTVLLLAWKIDWTLNINFESFSANSKSESNGLKMWSISTTFKRQILNKAPNQESES